MDSTQDRNSSIWVLFLRLCKFFNYKAQMVKIFPFIFVLLWSSAFITTKPIIDNSDPFTALAFRFLIVGIGFFLFSIYSKQNVFISK